MVPILFENFNKENDFQKRYYYALRLVFIYIQYSLEENIYITIALLTITPPPLPPPPQKKLVSRFTQSGRVRTSTLLEKFTTEQERFIFSK